MKIDVKHIFEVGGARVEPSKLLLRIDRMHWPFHSARIKIVNASSELPSWKLLLGGTRYTR